MKTKMKLIIAGSRSITDIAKIRDLCDEQLRMIDLVFKEAHDSPPVVEIVSGGAIGVDRLGEQWAAENNLEVTQFLPDWDTHGKAAGFIRNRQMAEYADGLIAFWDGESRGTDNMIKEMNKLGKPVRVIRV